MPITTDYIKGNPEKLDRYEKETRDFLARPEGMIPIDAVARYIVDRRWHHKDFTLIANELEISAKTIREIRISKVYENQVWACYGRSPHIFNKHPRYEHCIRHMSHFFGITQSLAKKVLGDDWERYRPDPEQLNINF